MSKQEKKDDTPTVPNQTVTAPDAQQQQVQLKIDDKSAVNYYSSTARVWGSAEEIIVDLAQGIQPTAENVQTMKIDARVVMSPWAAKRLALALSQAVQRYEQAYGTLEIDPRRRMQNPPTTTKAS